MKTPQTQKLVILETEFVGGGIDKFVESHHYEVEARVTDKSYIFRYGRGNVRKIVPRFETRRTYRGHEQVIDRANTHWHISYLPGSDRRPATRIYAYVPEAFPKRVKRPTLKDISEALLVRPKFP